MCEFEGSALTVDRIGSVEECPRLALRSGEWHSYFRVRDLWRHWTKGNLGAVCPDCHETMADLILLYDDIVSEVYRAKGGASL